MQSTFEEKKERACAQLSGDTSLPIALRKPTTNLFRPRQQGSVRELDLTGFKTVLDVDTERGVVDVEGLTTYHDLTNATLAHGFMPEVVPQLKSITIGGAVTGGGIESSSFRNGFVHETIEELEILLGDGSTVIATAENEHRDLFFGFPNSYGTLGYVVRVRARIQRVKPYVALSHQPFDNARDCMSALEQACESAVDFVDATVFAQDKLVLTTGQFMDAVPYASDYTYMKIYYRSLLERESDFLTVYDYIWRWDTDWFWCSKRFGVQIPWVRFLVGKFCLGSTFYTKLMVWNQNHQILRKLGIHRPIESVIQDVQIPIGNAAAFLDFFHREIGIRPVWMCPSRCPRPDYRFSLYLTDSSTLYVNFGFWDMVSTDKPDGHYNRLIEEKVDELGGKKSLYSSSYYSEDEFNRLYNVERYNELKQKYDSTGAFKRMYEKCVRRG